MLIDFGNSCCKWAVLHNESLGSVSSTSYLSTDPSAMAASLLSDLPVQQCEQIHAVSVLGPKFDQQFADLVKREAKIVVQYHVSQRRAYGVQLAYADPGTYGADRYAALVAAHHSGSGAKIVVDCGTAVTVDAIDSVGKHLGGLIMPGVELMCSVLAATTAGIPPIATNASVQYLNANTHDSVVSGSTLCLQHGLQSIIASMQQQLDSQVSLIVTGGARALLGKFLCGQWIERPELVLEGLQIMQSK